MHYLSIVTKAIIYTIIMMGLHYEYTHEEVTKSTATTVHALLLLQNSSDPMQYYNTHSLAAPFFLLLLVLELQC